MALNLSRRLFFDIDGNTLNQVVDKGGAGEAHKAMVEAVAKAMLLL
ncbi:hypothetical protein RCH06_000109 [Polaromonas sp. CG_9.5]|nr:hypothetical protein [Polaromonas sp. CG_9.5]